MLERVKKEPPYTVHRNVNGAAAVENSTEVTLKTKNKSYHMILHSHCCAYSWTKLLIQKDTWIPMFIAAPFTIAKTWKQSKCPSTEKWIKMVCVCVCVCITIKYYSAIKKNEIPFAATWIDLKMILLSEVIQKKQISYDIIYFWNLIQMNFV